MKKILSLVLCASMMLGLSGCGSLNNAAKGGLFGAGGGAAIGAAVGAVAGGTAGTLIGKKMDKQARELAQIEGAQVDTVTDQNNLKAIKVTFDNGILFGFNKTNLSAGAKQSLSKFAASLQNNPQTNVQIWGFTDNKGTREVNDRVSAERAQVVKTYLNNAGVSNSRMTSAGYAWDNPVASNDTEAGRAQNRRVEVYITANEKMIEEANAGTLQ